MNHSHSHVLPAILWVQAWGQRLEPQTYVIYPPEMQHLDPDIGKPSGFPCFPKRMTYDRLLKSWHANLSVRAQHFRPDVLKSNFLAFSAMASNPSQPRPASLHDKTSLSHIGTRESEHCQYPSPFGASEARDQDPGEIVQVRPPPAAAYSIQEPLTGKASLVSFCGCKRTKVSPSACETTKCTRGLVDGRGTAAKLISRQAWKEECELKGYLASSTVCTACHAVVENFGSTKSQSPREMASFLHSTAACQTVTLNSILPYKKILQGQPLAFFLAILKASKTQANQIWVQAFYDFAQPGHAP